MTTICLILLLVMRVLALEAKDLLHAVIFLGVFSLIIALLFFYLHAPDVALTEAAVGAGVSTVIFLWVIRKTREAGLIMRSFKILLVVLLLGGVLVFAVDFDLFAVNTIKKYYFQYGSAETGAINLVTAIYLGYRAFDTLGETIVLLVSIAGVMFFLGNHYA